jgi:hypothetical protein
LQTRLNGSDCGADFVESILTGCPRHGADDQSFAVCNGAAQLARAARAVVFLHRMTE